MGHTKEPWEMTRSSDDGWYIWKKDHSDDDSPHAFFRRAEDAVRALNCLDACANLPEPEKNIEKLVKVSQLEQILEHANNCEEEGCTKRCYRFREALAPFKEKKNENL